MKSETKEAAFVVTESDRTLCTPGEWYMFFVLGGFTQIGQYVCPLGYNKHRFRHVVHLANAGGMFLPDICAKGPGTQTILRGPYPGDWRGEVLHVTDYFAKKPWVK